MSVPLDSQYEQIAATTVESSGRKKLRTKRKVKKPDTNDYEYEYTDIPSVPLSQTIPSPPPPPRLPPSQPPKLPPTRPTMPRPTGAGVVELPKRIELNMPGGPEISKFAKRKKKAKVGMTKVYQDAANSCRIELDDDGNVLSVMLSDDLHHTFLKFGKETYEEADAIWLVENGLIPIVSKKKPFEKPVPQHPYWAPEHMDFSCAYESVGRMGDNKKYKKVKIKKTKLKSRKAKAELRFAADKADLVIDEYTDKIGKVYVAFPDAERFKTYLFALPERMHIITEETSNEIPIRKADDKKANWYVQDTSSEESEEEPDFKPETHESSIGAIDDYATGGLISRGAIGFGRQMPVSMKGWTPTAQTRLSLE